MAGYWPSSCSSRGPLTRRKRTRPISSHLERTSLVNKGFIIWLSGNFFLRDTTGSPERTGQFHLARSGSQPQRRIWFILPAHGANHIISLIIIIHHLFFPLGILCVYLPPIVMMKIPTRLAFLAILEQFGYGVRSNRKKRRLLNSNIYNCLYNVKSEFRLG